VQDRTRPRVARERRSAVVALRQKRRGGRGTGDESPPDSTKGPCRWKAPRVITSQLLSREVGDGGLGSYLTSESSKGERSAKATPTFRGRGRGDRGVRGSIASGAVGRKRPRSTPRLQKSRNRGSACPVTIRRSGLGCRETPGPPVKSRGALVSAGRPRGESRGASRERTRYGCTSFRQVAEVGWTHRAPCTPIGRKTCWRANKTGR
jgi:hypothetical protein